MLSYSEAETVFQHYIRQMGERIGMKLMEVPGSREEFPEYFVFFYNAEAFLVRKESSERLAGNAPLVIDKYWGEVYVTGTGRDINYYLEEFERKKLPGLRTRSSKDDPN